MIVPTPPDHTALAGRTPGSIQLDVDDIVVARNLSAVLWPIPGIRSVAADTYVTVTREGICDPKWSRLVASLDALADLLRTS